jgi:hypothetical protein
MGLLEDRIMSSQWNNLTETKREAFERSMNAGSAAAGAVLLQTYINRVVQQLTVRELGALAVLPKKQGQGDKEYINVRTALEYDSTTASSSGGEWVDDTDSVSVSTGTYAQKSFEYKTMVTRGKVTRFLQARGRNYGDLLAESLKSKADDFANALEYGLINGDQGAVAKQCNGLMTLLNGLLDVNRFFPMRDTSGAATNVPQDLTLAKLDEAIDAVKGAASKQNIVILCSKAGSRQLNALLQVDQQFSDIVEIDAGFRVRSYDGIPIVQSSNVLDTYAISATDVLTSYSSGTSTAFVILNLDYVYVAELTPTTVMPLAKDSSQFDSYDIFWDGAPVVSNIYGASVVTQVSVA